MGRIQTGHTDSPPHPSLWKVVARVQVFVIAPVAINTLIGFKKFPPGDLDGRQRLAGGAE